MRLPSPCADFQSPSAEFGPVPFWWWVGEPLDRERLCWQLDRLREKGVRNAIVSYNHHGDGSPNRGKPEVFSSAWWDLLRDLLRECRARGMQLSFQDYTLLNPTLEEIGCGTPEMRGAGELRETHARLGGGEEARLRVEAGGEAVAACAYPLREDRASSEGAVELGAEVREGELVWRAPKGSGEWLLSLSWCREKPFDPLHPQSGREVIERFYAPFEREVGEHLGTTLPISFQDELDFGGVMPRWSRVLPAEFAARKGYALGPLLAALWHDLGPVSPKLRIDYADVVVRLLEERYFIPVFEWHERRGLLFGNDNIGRGGIEAGRRAYGDVFRTMRWFSAPGTDDPSLSGPRAFKGLKVNSSIAHLHERPRVWNECFHSSGWGTAPSEVVAALNADFALGATVVNLHGLYYSTFGGWWEWAPPDFHFRQPYWDDTEALSGYATRLCQTLSQGVHVCDVAILYPITALEGGLNPRVYSEAAEEGSVSERQAGNAGERLDAAEAAAFGLGRHLFEAGVDFDFMDFESLERAEISGGELRVAGEGYRVLVLPHMSSLRFSTLRRARDFARSGGLVIFYGCLPVASERAGAEDAELAELVRDLMEGEGSRGSGGALFVPAGYQVVLDEVVRHAGRDFDPATTGFQALHRRTKEADFYFVFNPAKHEVADEVAFRSAGRASRLDAWTGETREVAAGREIPASARVALRLAAGEAALLRFDLLETSANARGIVSVPSEGSREGEDLVLDESWECELEPTLDNRHGDFRRPPSPLCLGPEARRFRHAREGETFAEEWAKADHDDRAWPQVTCAYGQRFWCLGPIKAEDAELEKIERELASAPGIAPELPVRVGGRECRWRPYAFSTRWGVENDPHLMDWAAGPHGLKGEVPDEFIDLHSEEPGAVWLLWTAVETAEAREAVFTMGSRSAYAAWLNGERVMRQDEALEPGRQSIWNLPHYRSEPRTGAVALQAGANPLLLRFTQPTGQRVRAYAAFVPSEGTPREELRLPWFASPEQPVFNPCPEAPARANWYRFASAPALREVQVVSRASARVWCEGVELRKIAETRRADGVCEARFETEARLPGGGVVAVRVEPVAASFGGDALPEPVRMECAKGTLRLGDWCAQGLESYSGRVWYRQTVILSREQAERAESLDIGRVAVTAELWANGSKVGTLVAPPWRSVLPRGLLREGANLVEIRVANTLANHYRIGVPTPYAPAGQTVSGLLGPVRLRFRESAPHTL